MTVPDVHTYRVEGRCTSDPGARSVLIIEVTRLPHGKTATKFSERCSFSLHEEILDLDASEKD